MTGATSYRSAWDKSVGPSTSWLPAAACTFKTGVANVAYSMILADTFQAIASSAGYSVSRTQTLLGMTATILLPLCLLKDLKSLAPFSLLGICGTGFTAGAMGYRYLAGDYALPAGRFLKDLPATALPKFGSRGMLAARSPQTFILLSMLSTAFLAHYNSPKYYVELKDNTVKRFNTVVASAFGIAILLFAGITSVGFLTFGASSGGFILNNYSTKDQLATLCRVAIAVSLVFSYPLAFVGIREGLFDLASVPSSSRSAKVPSLSLLVLSVVTALAWKIRELSFVLSFGGATLGNAIVFVFPALMFRAAVKNGKRKDLEGEATVAGAIGVGGVVMGAIGAYQAIKGLKH